MLKIHDLHEKERPIEQIGRLFYSMDILYNTKERRMVMKMVVRFEGG